VTVIYIRVKVRRKEGKKELSVICIALMVYGTRGNEGTERSRGVVYMMKSRGQSLGGCVPFHISHLTPKQRHDDRYDFNELRTEPRIPNQDDRRAIRMSWSIVSKAAE